MAAQRADLLATVEDALGPRLVHRGRRPARTAKAAPWPDWVDPEVRDRMGATGVSSLWSHQAQAADLLWQGRDVVVATGTASGKSLAYQLPALTWARSSRPRRRSTTVYLAPTKALAADQAAALQARDVSDAAIAVVDGDTSREERDWAARYGDIVLTNPDMLHRSLLPGHRRWRELFAGLRLVVVDESHHYRGVFGAHVAWTLRRLVRVATAYGASPAFVLLSATMADPGATASRLVGRSFVVVSDDGSPAAPLEVALADTARREDAAHAGRTGWSARMLAALTAAGHRTICFVRSRRAAEHVALSASSTLARTGATATVAAYRGGYLPEERRWLEQALRSGELTGVAATTALELGVDIAGVDAVVMGGWPGTRAGFWQQAGRAGRHGRPGVAVLLAGADPLEQYVVRHPDTLLGAPLEQSVVDAQNPYVCAPHLCAAAAESPWTADEVAALPAPVAAVIDELTVSGVLRRRPDGWYWPRNDRPSDATDIRGGLGPVVQLVEAETGRLLGTVDRSRASVIVHPGAVYVHQGAAFVVTDLDLEASAAMLVRGDPGYDTVARSTTEVRLVDEARHTQTAAARMSFGTVEVASAVVGYQKRRREGGAVIEEVALDLPEQRLRTTAVWWSLPDDVVSDAGVSRRRVQGAAHAAEHAAIGLLPLFAACDPWDVGGTSSARHPDTGRLTVAVHDAYPGGAGLAARAFESASHWLTATRDAVAACPCSTGCPSCVQSPRCGSGNTPLDKAGAVRLLTTVVTGLA